MAEAARKALAETLSPSFNMSDLEIEAELASVARLVWAEAVGMGRGMQAKCGTPRWHVLLFEESVVVDMKVVCTRGVKNMLGHQAKEVAG